MKKGFTLIELVMVIAIIAIVSSLAVMKLGSLREHAARTVSLANQNALDRAVTTFLAAQADGKIDYLDSLMSDRGASGFGEGDGKGFQRELMAAQYCYKGAGMRNGIDYSETNTGLTPRLYGPGAEGGNCFIPYSLSQAEVSRLNNRGFRYVLRHIDFANQAGAGSVGEDGVRLAITDAKILDPHESACIARAVTNGMIVCAISPLTKNGRDIYRDMGQKLLDTEAITDTNGVVTDVDAAFEQVKATGGALLAFGLGADASIIGNNLAGLEAVPLATYPIKKFYRQFILLFRVDTSTPAGRLDYVGALDPCGFTVQQARKNVE